MRRWEMRDEAETDAPQMHYEGAIDTARTSSRSRPPYMHNGHPTEIIMDGRSF